MHEDLHPWTMRGRADRRGDHSRSPERPGPPEDAVHALARLVRIAATDLRVGSAEFLTALTAEFGLVEKEPAFEMREANHRFKNEMQILASGIQAQTLELPSQPTSRDCLRCLGRVMGLAQVHSALEEVTGDRVPLAPLLPRLANSLIAAAGKADRVKLRFEAEALSVDSETAVGIALFFNEAMVNALKHGFPDARPGEIAITMRRDDVGGRLVVHDDGAGASPAALGDYRMLRGLARQIDGQFRRLDVEEGFAVELRFQLASAGSRQPDFRRFAASSAK